MMLKRKYIGILIPAFLLAVGFLFFTCQPFNPFFAAGMRGLKLYWYKSLAPEAILRQELIGPDEDPPDVPPGFEELVSFPQDISYMAMDKTNNKLFFSSIDELYYYDLAEKNEMVYPVNLNSPFPIGVITGLAVDGKNNRIYYCFYDGSSNHYLNYCNLDGTVDYNILSGLSIRDVQIDAKAEKLFWLQYDGVTDDEVWVADIVGDGAFSNIHEITGTSITVKRIALDSNDDKVYLYLDHGTFYTLCSAPMSGGPISPAIITFAYMPQDIDIDSFNKIVYYTTSANGVFMRDFAQSSPVQLHPESGNAILLDQWPTVEDE